MEKQDFATTIREHVRAFEYLGGLAAILQRKVLTPNDFPNLDTLAERLLDFQHYWEAAAKPFEWRFSRQDLNALLAKLNTPSVKVE